MEQKLPRINLIKMIIQAWANGDLTDNQAMTNVTVIMGIRKPSPECKEWAKSLLSNKSKVE
jgi:hypothetical protein